MTLYKDWVNSPKIYQNIWKVVYLKRALKLSFIQFCHNSTGVLLSLPSSFVIRHNFEEYLWLGFRWVWINENIGEKFCNINDNVFLMSFSMYYTPEYFTKRLSTTTTLGEVIGGIFAGKCYQRGTPHGTLGLDPMWIGDTDPKTTLPPRDLDSDPSCALCCVGQCVRSSPAV